MAKKIKDPVREKDAKFPLPEYSREEDIYNQEKEVPLEEDEATGRIIKKKKGIAAQDMNLDVPGAEADDANEAIGEEDEENNYYSLGGDNHENLEEDNGDQ
ncbi:MAG: hypothetical protein QM764_21130 [Chitinophagaceae bacterium]